ncbi:hypothetical protein Tco_1030493 [Tanacetum coccineum]|uniref:Monodehydroascorbate reductase n=1 Tax=Tanacetum coccineum TaxID=301880 RepID=A0ABQ5G6D3_9ASTR
MRHDSSTRLYSSQLDEQWFTLHKDILRDTLDITPSNDNNPFVAPPSSDTVIEYVNTLGYPNTLRNVSAMSVNALYQPWRAVLSMINMCLTGKTARYDRPRHPVLHILWGVIHRSNIDYAERIWEEFVQSIQTFLTDRKSLATESRAKKKSLHLLIPNVRFTKFIIHHLRSKHNIHPRIDSPLHYSHKKNILNFLKYTGKDGRVTFGMPIPDTLLTDEISTAPYYSGYLEHVAAYQRYLAEEHDATKTAKQTKPSTPKAIKPAKPVESPMKDQGRKRKPAKETTDAPSPAKRSKAGKVIKKRLQKSSLQLVDEGDDDGVPEKEPKFDDEVADMQRAVEESLKDVHAARQGPLPPVVIKESKSGKFQPLPKVHGKGKRKSVKNKQLKFYSTFRLQRKRAVLISLSFRSTPLHQLYPRVMKNLLHCMWSLVLTDSETESDDEVSPVINAEAQDEGHAGPNPGVQDKESQPLPSHVVHDGPNLEHMDFEATGPSTQHEPKHLDKEFTTMAYLNVQENLKLPIEDQVILKEPACSAGTLSSLQNIDKELSFTNQFLLEKSQEDELEKTEVQSMATVPIHQDTSSVPLITTPVIDLTASQSVSTIVQAPLPASTTIVTSITTTTSLPPPPPQPQQGSSNSIFIQRIGELELHMAELIQANLALEERLDKHGSRLYKLENLNIPQKVKQAVDEVVTDAVD